MKLSHFTIIMDYFPVGPYICPSSAVFLRNNLTHQICDTLWHFGPPTYTKPELIWISNMKLSHFTIIMDYFLVGPYICPSSAVILCKNLTYQICDTLWHFGPPTYTKPKLIWISNMKLSHFTIIMDYFLVGPYICPSSAVFLYNNLTYQIWDTLWHFRPPTYTKPELIWICNMKLSHFTIIMDEFLVVPNICQSSAIFLRNNLTYQICDTLWHFGPILLYTLTLWPSNIHKSRIDMDGNVKLSNFTIIMDEFLVVPNICPNSAVFLHNNLTYRIYHVTR